MFANVISVIIFIETIVIIAANVDLLATCLGIRDGNKPDKLDKFLIAICVFDILAEVVKAVAAVMFIQWMF